MTRSLTQMMSWMVAALVLMYQAVMKAVMGMLGRGPKPPQAETKVIPEPVIEPTTPVEPLAVAQPPPVESVFVDPAQAGQIFILVRQIIVLPLANDTISASSL